MKKKYLAAIVLVAITGTASARYTTPQHLPACTDTIHKIVPSAAEQPGNTRMHSANKGFDNDPVRSAFNRNFADAANVRWSSHKDFTKATFVIDGQTMFAYFKPDGEQLAVTRNLKPANLSLNLWQSLKSDYAGYRLTELFEVVADGQTAYYATLENDTRTIILKADASSGWATFKKEKKKSRC